MIDDIKIRDIARKVATANLSSSTAVSDIKTRSFIDSEGHDALRITIIVSPDGASRIQGNATLNTLVEIQAKLRAAGEGRSPLVEFATEGEPDNGGDS
jgi:hypothetical protein